MVILLQSNHSTAALEQALADAQNQLRQDAALHQDAIKIMQAELDEAIRRIDEVLLVFAYTKLNPSVSVYCLTVTDCCILDHCQAQNAEAALRSQLAHQSSHSSPAAATVPADYVSRAGPPLSFSGVLLIVHNACLSVCVQEELKAARDTLTAELATERENYVVLKQRTSDLLGKHRELRDKFAQSDQQWQQQRLDYTSEIADLSRLLEQTKAELHMIRTAEQVLIGSRVLHRTHT